MKRAHRRMLRRAWSLGTVTAGLALLLSTSALATTIVGTPKNDVLHGTAKADKLYGNAGNDKLYGLGGNDKLFGGPGNDLLVGGPGADKLDCGAGHDIAQADASDTVSATCEIVTGPALPSLSVGSASVSEGNSGTTKLSFPLTLSKPVTWNVSVAYATADGTASVATDYAAARGTIAFAPGETSKTIDVMVNGDTVFEPDETLSVSLSGAVNATIAGGTATGTIKNDDQPQARPGHYSGMTSQNRAITFDVATDGASLSNLVFYIDVECDGFKVTDVPFDFGSSQIPIKSDGTFSIAGNASDSGVSVTYSVAGTFGAGSAKGTARADFTIDTPFGRTSCSTEALTWNAS